MSDEAAFRQRAPGGYDPDQFSRALSAVEGWARAYLESLERRPAGPVRAPGETLELLGASPPEQGEGMGLWDCVGDELREIIEPGLMHWQSPGFFAYFPCSSSLPGVMGELTSAVLNVNGMLWSTSPSATELEMRVVDWCAELFGLPESFRFDGAGSVGGGCIQGTASEGALAALCAARKLKVDAGEDRSSMCVYTSTQAHSSIVKSAMIAGLADGPDDRSRVRLIETDDHLRMRVDVLREAIEADVRAGLTPCFVSTTQGTTSTGAFDPLDGIGEMIASLSPDARPWLHVDAAWAGVAAVCPDLRWMLGGVERADSICINPHKWLMTNFDCDLFWVRDREALTGAMSITPDYLRNKESDAGRVVDYRDWHVPLGRRMRAIKLWWVLRYFGAEGLRAHIEHHIALAQRFERHVQEHPRLKLAFDRSLSLVCFVVDGPDEQTSRLIDRVNERGRVLITQTRVPIAEVQRRVARVAIGASSVELRHIEMLIEEIDTVLKELVE
jgi:aromatic-L-amino-acid decarboxylase